MNYYEIKNIYLKLLDDHIVITTSPKDVIKEASMIKSLRNRISQNIQVLRALISFVEKTNKEFSSSRKMYKIKFQVFNGFKIDKVILSLQKEKAFSLNDLMEVKRLYYKDHTRKAQRAYYDKHKETINLYYKQWLKENKERVRKSRAKRYQDNKSAYKKRGLIYYEKNKKKIRKKCRDYYQKNKIMALKYKFSQMTFEDWVNLIDSQDEKDLKQLELIIQLGFDPEIKDEDDCTPFDVLMNRIETVQIHGERGGLGKAKYRTKLALFEKYYDIKRVYNEYLLERK